jgi:protein SCO1/2
MGGTVVMSKSGLPWKAALAAAGALTGLLTGPAEAQYFRRPASEIDPNIMLIDEQAVLGAKLDAETPFIDHTGREFRWADILGKPVIVVLSYYTCDGSCSIINASLAELLSDVKAVAAGTDFRILTLSFDKHDKLETAGAFRKHLNLAKDLAPHWSFATFKNETDLKSQTERIGFKFFWSPEDRIFLHPGAFLFFSPEGRLIRVLYQGDVTGRDVELAVLDAKQGQFRPREIVNFMLSLCYSYSYRDGKYVMSIPIIVGLGALGAGLTTLFGSMLYYKISTRVAGTGDQTHAKTT